MSCRCITLFSLLNAYTGPIGRSGVPTVSWFKNAKDCFQWRAAPVLSLIQGNEAPSKPPLPRGMQILMLALHPTCSYTDKFRFTPVAVAVSVSSLWTLPRPGSSTLTASVLGFSCCPAWHNPFALGGNATLRAGLAASQLAHLHAPFNAMHIFNMFWKGYCGAEQELALLETYTLCKESRLMWQKRWEAEIVCHWTTNFFQKHRCQKAKDWITGGWDSLLLSQFKSSCRSLWWVCQHGKKALLGVKAGFSPARVATRPCRAVPGGQWWHG